STFMVACTATPVDPGDLGDQRVDALRLPVACSRGSSYDCSSHPRGIRRRRYRMEGSMVKAAVLWGFNEPLKIDSLKLKAPREDEVVVKVAASGVGHSALSVVKMVIPIPPPVVLGHEGAGVVEEVGKSVKDLKAGDHVVLSWVENCGRCHYCISGRD